MSDSYVIDLDAARSMVNAFAGTTGVRCRLISAAGETLYQSGRPEDECAYLKALPGIPPPCTDLHLRGIRQAERFGGRYIYACPSSLAYCASPIMVGGALAGGLVAGPVLLMDTDDLLEELIERRGVRQDELASLWNFLCDIPHMESARLSQLSLQLFADTLCIGDNSRELFLQRDDGLQQQNMGQYIHQVKAVGQDARYPVEKEPQLYAAVARGDRAAAAALLNDLLGHIFFLTPDR